MKNMISAIGLIGLLVMPFTLHAQSITSPDGGLQVTCTTGDGTASYQLFSLAHGKMKPLFSISSSGLFTDKSHTIRLVSTSKPRRLKDCYTMLAGKRKRCVNEAREVLFNFVNEREERVNVRFRVYNDGIAFRYEYWPVQAVCIQDELTSYHMPAGINRWTQPYNISYEDFFPMNRDGGEARHWGYPALFQLDDSLWTLLTEAGIHRINCASSLDNSVAPSCYKVRLAQNNVEVRGAWQSPWRVAIIGSLARVVESTLVTDVSEPARLKDVSWIKPGVVSWIYWAYNHGSCDFERVKQYIDMAVTLKLPYVLIDWEWDKMGNGGDIEAALAYAREKGVKPLLWYNSSTSWTGDAAGPLFRLNTPEAREKEFAWLNRMGVAGVKIDFFAGDSLSTMNYYLDLLEDAARHHLLVDFHGATIPRGWQRTYPHLMTVEAVYGAEWYNNGPALTSAAAAHNCTLPFTRNVVGSMDYTPCTFSDSQHLHITTSAHELALTVVFESALQNLADRPSSYLAQPREVQDFLSALPAAWDDTHLLDGYPGDHVVMARCKNGVWYIGGLNGTNEAMNLHAPLHFLKKGKYRVTLFADGKEPRSFVITSEVLQGRSLTVSTLARGGFVAVIHKM